VSQENAFSVDGKDYQLSGWWKRVGAYLLDWLFFISSAWILFGIFAYVPFYLREIVTNLGANDSGQSFSGSGVQSVSDNSGAQVIADILQFYIIIVPIPLLIITPFLYWGLFMRRKGEKNGQSLGKQIFGIRVVREDGKEVGFWWAGLRQVIVISLLFMNVLLFITVLIAPILNFLWPLWDQKRQALHDKIVKSRVVLAK
jgi:uncharacterized RDD family membrane protein YckC